MAEEIPENPELTGAIVAAVEQYWAKAGRAVLLSYLGKKLKDHGLWDSSIAPFTLLDYVNTHAAGHLRREARPGHEHMIGLFPKHAELSENLTVYFTSPPKQRPSMFQQFVWDAFQSEIPSGHVRIISLSKSLGQDRPSPITQLDAGDYLIEPSDQPLPNYRRDGKAMREAIEKWAGKNGLDVESLISRPAAAAGQPAAESPTAAPRRSLLELVLGTLSPQDQQRVTMPLDIVDKLRRHQV